MNTPTVRNARTTTPLDYDELIDMQKGLLHGSLYTDRAVLEDEFDRIWHRGWVYAAHDSEISQTGDYVMRTIGRVPIILSRSSDGQVNVLVNRCPHRGNRVVNDESGNSNNFQCGYHAWTFNNKGRLLGVPYPEGYPKSFDKAELCMATVPRVGIYRGFVFVSLAPTGLSFEDHLGPNGHALIDRCCDAAPEGEITVKSGALLHQMNCNWKMIVENDTDGYHPPFVHSSLFKAHAARPGSRLTRMRPAVGTKGPAAGSTAEAATEGPKSQGVVRDWNDGHAELDGRAASRASGRLFDWLPGADASKLGWWVEAVEKRVGTDRARKILSEGPPHATIFPNLFLGRLNIITIHPIDVDDTIQSTAPIGLKGAPEFDTAILIHTQGGLGPAGLLFTDDDEIGERNQLGLQARSPEWVYLGRGLEREVVDPTEGDSIVSDMSDETSQRALWKRYLAEMRVAPATS